MTHQLVPEVPPRRIALSNESQLPRSAPLLDLLLALDRISDVLVPLKPDELANSVYACKPFDGTRSMLASSLCEVARHAEIQRTVRLTGKEINESGLGHSRDAVWIPAYAGMTKNREGGKTG